MEGNFLFGTSISAIKLLSFTALIVVGPKTAILVSFCMKSGKFSYKDVIPVGEKNAKTSYCTFERSERSRCEELLYFGIPQRVGDS